MEKIELAKEFLLDSPLKNSYLIARLDEYNIHVGFSNKIEGEIEAVLIESEGYASMRGREKGITSLLHELEEGEYRFHAVDNEAYQVLEEVLELEDDHPTWFFKRPKRYFEEPKLDVDELVLDDAEVINEHWGLQGTDSTDYISERIENGPAFGIRRDGELVAWSLTHYMTEQVINLGFLHVKEGWRRKGFAKAITEHMCRYAEKNGQTPVVDIFKDNDASISLAESLGFQCISEHHWCNVKK